MTLTSPPVTVAPFESGRLAAGISASATTITVSPIFKTVNGVRTKQGFDTTSGIAIISQGDFVERISFEGSSVDATTKVTTLTTCVRGLSVTSTTASFSGGTGKIWPKGAKITLVADVSYFQSVPFKNVANTFSAKQTLAAGADFTSVTRPPKLPSLTQAEEDALTPEEGMMWKNTDTGTMRQYSGGAISSIGTDATANASETVAGKVEIATAAQRAAGTGTGETGALLVPSNDALVKTSSGAGDENKIPVLNASGQLASGFVNTSSLAVVPTGAMFQWLTDTAPTGYLLCYGQVVSQATYAALYAVIGHTFASDPGGGNFTLPDLRGRFPLGQDDMGGSSANRVTATEADTLGSTHGAETITLTDAQVPSQEIKVVQNNAGATTGPVAIATSSGTLSVGAVDTADLNTYTTEGGGGAHNNMPPNITVNYIIKT